MEHVPDQRFDWHVSDFGPEESMFNSVRTDALQSAQNEEQSTKPEIATLNKLVICVNHIIFFLSRKFKPTHVI